MAKNGYTEAKLKEMGLVETSPGVYESVNKGKTSPFIEAVKNPALKIAVKEVVNVNSSFVIKSKYPITLDITPIGKPRMTQRDKWLNPPRKPVKLYWEFKDKLKSEVNIKEFVIPESNFHVTFILPMPNSWSGKKRGQMDKTPHQSKPDNDNMMKAFKDCLCDNDSHIWDYRITKLWGVSGRIIINLIP